MKKDRLCTLDRATCFQVVEDALRDHLRDSGLMISRGHCVAYGGNHIVTDALMISPRDYWGSGYIVAVSLTGRTLHAFTPQCLWFAATVSNWWEWSNLIQQDLIQLLTRLTPN